MKVHAREQMKPARRGSRFRIAPRRIQARREVNGLPDRDPMRDGAAGRPDRFQPADDREEPAGQTMHQYP
ncbi:hypothetical protein [Actinomadura chokoriensis]|uniref:Uncharacterized protein n=1 Tax=Actinomadura chokoriensis TaxID=454156 RepID=A0ABV4R156_9ACTN